MRQSSALHSLRQGFTLLELVVVIVILVLLAGMLLPMTRIQSENPRRSNCGSNQRQIVYAMMIYQNDHQGQWPVFLSSAGGRRVQVGDPLLDGTATAIASLEFIADWTGGDMTAKLFSCPSHREIRPGSPAGSFSDPNAISAWAAAGPHSMGYSYDWSAPTESTSSRVITADRDVKVHKGAVMVVFADGHIGTVNPSNGAFINRAAAKDDDIYTDAGDGPMGIPGAGSATRAFVR